MTKEEAIAYWKQRSEHIHNWLEENEDVDCIGEYVEAIDMAIEALQEVQKHKETFEWCHDCKEYDTENYCCHRWSKVIRNVVEELKEEPPTIPCFTESAEAYKAWTGEEMGGGRLIDADALHEELMWAWKEATCEEERKTLRWVIDLVDIDSPTVSADRPQGEWIIHTDDLFPEESTQECSVCHEKQFVHMGNDDNYCPNCGADMRGGDGE